MAIQNGLGRGQFFSKSRISQYPGMLCYILWIQKCIFDACTLNLHNSTSSHCTMMSFLFVLITLSLRFGTHDFHLSPAPISAACKSWKHSVVDSAASCRCHVDKRSTQWRQLLKQGATWWLLYQCQSRHGLLASASSVISLARFNLVISRCNSITLKVNTWTWPCRLVT